MLTQGIEVQKYIRASAGRAGLNVRWEAINHPRHDGDTIYLPRITSTTTKKQLKELMCSTDHEVGHDRYSCFELLKEKNLDSRTSILAFLWNFIEDARVNNIEAREYEGFRELWDELLPETIQNIVNSPKSEMTTLMKSLMKWEANTFSTFPACAHVASTAITDKKLDEILNTHREELDRCSYILEKRAGSEATYGLARKLFKEMGGDPDREEELAKARAKGSPTDEKGDEDGTEAAEDEGSSASGDTDAESTDAKSTRSDEWKIIKKIIKIKPEELAKAKVLTANPLDRMSCTGIEHECSDDDDDDMSGWDITPFEDVKVVNFPKNTSSYRGSDILEREDDWFIDMHSKKTKDATTPENFANQVRRLIQIRAKSRTEYGVKKGKLDQARLSRICAATPGFSERIFKRKYVNDTLNTAVTVLVDCSGSMSGEKFVYATETACLLNHVFKVLNLPLELLGFTDITTGEPLMYVYKEFTTPFISKERMVESFAKSSCHMDGNPDGENILWAYNRLIQRKEKRRCLIVLSDGQPSAAKGHRGCGAFTKQVIQEIEASRKIDLYGIGILSDSVQRYYKHHSVINNVEDIPMKILEVIEKKLIG